MSENYRNEASHHPGYTMLPKVAEDAVVRAGVRLSSPSQKFVEPSEDKTSAGEKVRA